MTESLPLIPEKGGAVCADVRPVLREVFREYDCLPPLAPRPAGRVPDLDWDSSTRLPNLNQWIEKYESDRGEILQREGELQQQYAARLSRAPLPNIYRLRPPAPPQDRAPAWRGARGIMDRKDLVPTLKQKSNVEGTLWVRSILNGSSGDLSPLVVRGSRVNSPVRLSSPVENSLQSISIGALRPAASEPPAPRAAPPAAPDHILCVPPHLDFVNFTVGQLHTQALRLVNVSKFEVRLSVRPPAARELDIELAGCRGLTVTSGAAAEFKVNFRPRDVRVLRDVLLVRVSSGRLLHIPISCYMQPPLLDILVPAVSSSAFLCTPGRAGGAAGAAGAGGDCVELGARLLGDVHCVPVLVHCAADHAAFFLLTEDAWLSFTLDVVTARGSLLAAPFVVWPAWWRGGGAVRGCVWCRAHGAGLQEAALRVLATTAVVRPLTLIADALYFRPEHITLEAQEKDYDICNDDDPACEYYVNLGTAFPGRSLSATVQLVNHSPVVYSYYWSVRPWGACACWAEQEEEEPAGGEASSDGLCVGAREARDRELRDGPPPPPPPPPAPEPDPPSSARVRVEPARGALAPRSSCGVHVRAPDVGRDLGVQRAVLMLILKDIPKESLPDDYDPMIVKTEVLDSAAIPGVKRWKREVCELVCAQLEVWWDVAPARFVLDPPALQLQYSRRITALALKVRATQLFGCDGLACAWRLPAHVPPPAPAPLLLAPAHSTPATLRYLLPVLPNHFPETDIITLEAAQAEWQASSAVTRRCATRHPALRPARRWLGVVPPGASMHSALELYNDTYQHICWWGDTFRWHGENPPSVSCGGGAGGAREPCGRCQERACTCTLARPTRGALHHRERQPIAYAVHAPEHDGCVATLIKVQRTSADVAHVAGGAGTEARAALLAYRVLAPRLVLRVLPCAGDKHAACEGCALDEGEARSPRGTALLRPRAALPLGRRSCYRLRFTNVTPLPTTVSWDPPLEEDVLKVVFSPSEFHVGSYAQVEIQVALEARRVCARRVFVRRARVRHAYQPLYLVVDAAVSGLEIVCEVPLGGDEKTDTTVIMRRTQAEVFPWEADREMPQTMEEIFEEEDKKRAERAENICRCKFNMVYVPPPPPRPRPPHQDGDDYPPIEIVWEPPAFTRVCACQPGAAPCLPAVAEPYCLQFHRLPLRTVRTRTVLLRNESPLAGAWRAAVRRWPRARPRHLPPDEWASGAPGVCVQLRPAAGSLRPRARLALTVAVYADCWGLYRDQLAIKIDNLEAIVLDLWVEAEGAPLQLALQLGAPAPPAAPPAPALCWLSAADPARALRVKNVSRARLLVHAYVLAEHEYPQDELPFRLYLRLFDVQPATCPCLLEPEEESLGSCPPEMDTGVELFLAPDCGAQAADHFTVFPETTSMSPGEWGAWSVRLQAPPHEEPAPPSALLLRALPLDVCGEGWVRVAPAPQLVRLRQAPRAGCLRVASCELRARVCALHLPPGDVLRVRKRLRVQNVGNGPLKVRVRTDEPWAVVMEEQHASCGCACGGEADAARERDAPLRLMPRSSLEMCLEVMVGTAEALPAPLEPPAPPAAPAPSEPPAPPAAPAPPAYAPRRVSTTLLHFYDEDNILKTLPLVLELEFPVLRMEPATLDFGVVTDGDTKKSYYSVAHSSRTVALELRTEWVGGEGFRLHPRSLTLRPGARERVYIQYTARWCGAPVEGRCVVRAAGGAGAWCRAACGARAAPARDLARRLGPRDHTDDATLMPPLLPTPLCL